MYYFLSVPKGAFVENSPTFYTLLCFDCFALLISYHNVLPVLFCFALNCIHLALNCFELHNTLCCTTLYYYLHLPICKTSIKELLIASNCITLCVIQYCIIIIITTCIFPTLVYLLL